MRDDSKEADGYEGEDGDREEIVELIDWILKTTWRKKKADGCDGELGTEGISDLFLSRFSISLQIVF